MERPVYSTVDGDARPVPGIDYPRTFQEPKNRGRNRVTIPIKPWLAAALFAVLVSPSAEGACRTGFVERIDRVSQESKCVPQGVIQRQKLQ